MRNCVCVFVVLQALQRAVVRITTTERLLTTEIHTNRTCVSPEFLFLLGRLIVFIQCSCN